MSAFFKIILEKEHEIKSEIKFVSLYCLIHPPIPAHK